MKEYGKITVTIPNEMRTPRPETAYWEARKLAALEGGTLTGTVEARSTSEDFMTDSTTYIFEMEREVPEA